MEGFLDGFASGKNGPISGATFRRGELGRQFQERLSKWSSRQWNGTSGNVEKRESEGHCFRLRPLGYMRKEHLPSQSGKGGLGIVQSISD